jgi:hypothetical protein
MGNYLKIPGETPFPDLHPPRPRSELSGVVVLVLFSIFCAGGYVLVKYWRAQSPASNKEDAPLPVAVKPPSATIPIAEAEDLAEHLETASDEERKAAEEIKRCQEWIERVAPSLDRNYMALESRRLHAAAVASENAQRHVEQARKQLEITKNLLMERSN